MRDDSAGLATRTTNWLRRGERLIGRVQSRINCGRPRNSRSGGSNYPEGQSGSMGRRALKLGVVVAAIALVVGCSASVSVKEAEHPADERFDKLLADFDDQNSELQPPQTECNVGGEAQACGDSSLEIAAMVEDFAPRLRDAARTSTNRSHGVAFANALDLYAEGLRARTRGLAEQDDSLFRSGNATIEEAREEWESARTGLVNEAEG